MKTITHNLLSSQGLQDKILNKFIEKKTVKLPPPIMEDATSDENEEIIPI